MCKSSCLKSRFFFWPSKLLQKIHKNTRTDIIDTYLNQNNYENIEKKGVLGQKRFLKCCCTITRFAKMLLTGLQIYDKCYKNMILGKFHRYFLTEE